MTLPDASSYAPPHPLHLLIVGAGLCGLGAAISTALEGHKVTVFETASQLHEVGAGLQITPNGTRILRRWGISAELAPKAAAPSTLSIRRFDGRILAHRPEYRAEVEERYGAPIWCLHRVDLQQALAGRAIELGVHLRLRSPVKEVDFEGAAVVLGNGERIAGDVVLAADGLWSTTRNHFVGTPVPPKPTGDLAYRILLHADEISDPELQRLITTPSLNIWIGPDMHVVAYSVRGGRLFNMVLLVPDDLPEDVAKQNGDLEEMRKLFESWDPILSRFLSYVKKVDKWRLMHVPSLNSWRNAQGNFVMAGDSCHAMLPYFAQGANSALEDAAVLGALLGRAKSKLQTRAALSMYEKLRKDRVEQIARETVVHRDEFHLPDGEEQQERDRALARSFEADDGDDRWTHPKFQPWLFGYDAYVEVEKAFALEPF